METSGALNTARLLISYLMADIAVGRGVQGLARSGSAARGGRKTTGKKVVQSDGVYLHLFCEKADV